MTRAPAYGRRQRTEVDRQADLVKWCSCARDNAVLAMTVDELMARHGVQDRKFAEYHLVQAQRRARGER